MGTTTGQMEVSGTSTSFPTFFYNAACFRIIRGECPENTTIPITNIITTGTYESSLTVTEGTKFTITVSLLYPYDPSHCHEGTGTLHLFIDVDLSPDGTKLINPRISAVVAENLPSEYKISDNPITLLTCWYYAWDYAKQNITLAVEGTYSYNGQTLTLDKTELQTTNITFT